MKKTNNLNRTNQAIKRLSIMDDFVTKRPRIDREDNEENCHNNSHENLNDSHSFINFKRKPKKNIFDSSESEESICENDSESESMTFDEKRVLEYFNTAPIEDLSQITGCSMLKATQIEKARPFLTFSDLKVNKINQKIIDGCLEILSIKENLIQLLRKCESISSSLTESIKPLNIDENCQPDSTVFDQPKLLNSKLQLKSYQMTGINWLKIVHKENLNGILADEMGLGKTVQSIAFLSHLVETGVPGPHIVIVPTSTLNNWQREFQRWTPDLRVIIYYGSQDERRQLRNDIARGDSFDVILTTYNICISNKDDRLFMKRIGFYYGVFDEAHMLKNMLSIRYKYLSNFRIKRKLLLTGTPLQNNMVELISLLSFVMPNMFLTENEGLKKIFQMSQKSNLKQSSFNEDKIKQIKEMLMPFCLRRLKSQVLSQLPSKTVEIQLLPLCEDQNIIYRRIIEKCKEEQNINHSLDPKTTLTTVMELRKTANHSLLFRDYYDDAVLRKMSRDMLLDEDHITSNPDLIFEDFSYMNDFEIHLNCLKYEHAVGKYKLPNEMLLKSNKIQYLNDNLPKFIKNGDKILIFSQFVMVLNIIEEFLKYKEISYLRLDGSTGADDRQEFIDQFNEDENVKVFILTTRAGGLGINLTSANIVILYDIDYNPYNDRQAEDRSHRLGQTKDVRVIKLISKGTIDECILKIATEKLKLEQVTLSNPRNNNEDEEEDECVSSSSEPKDVDFDSLLKQAIDI